MLEQRGDLMRVLILSEESHRLILDQAKLPKPAYSAAIRRPDGLWDVQVDDEVAAAIDHARLQNESDDDAVSRLVRDAIGQRPS
ncbi:MAG: hypothetical protein JWQ89_1258 [Devosia sp.]|uniref:hypothetical protein n=1 Tax=Devosia sp. TaxID=1871048 RepID=UPI00260AFFAF|nr:hypothetical protein [Devosia sp.]MDB5539531.1 hypothetical protein [Devosia sp.]